MHLCPIWCYGSLLGRPIRQSVKTRDWTIALRLSMSGKQSPKKNRRRRLASGAPSRNTSQTARRANWPNPRLSVIETRSPHLLPITRVVISAICAAFGWRIFADFGARDVSAKTQRKEIKHLRAFGKFCKQHQWMTENFAKELKPPL